MLTVVYERAKDISPALEAILHFHVVSQSASLQILVKIKRFKQSHLIHPTLELMLDLLMIGS
jgi:hypothetical protein